MCVAAELPAGTTCTVAAPGACHVNKGTCDSGGLCEPGLAAPGTPCANPDGGVQAGGCSTAACDAAGACKLVPKPSGTQCGAGPYTCSGPAMCDGTGTCIPPTDGTHCFVWYSYPGGTADEGQNLCLDGACASGVCVPKPLVGQACTPPSPDANPCISGVYTCDAKGFCGSATAPGKPCKAQDPCTTNGKCDEKGKCVGDIAVGASCGAAPGPCQLLQCQADGSCKAVATPGLSCSTADPCLVGGKCDVAGQCIGTVPVGASCGAAPGPCLARQCQSDGSCTTVPAPGGACWIDMNPCKSGVCGGDGTCKPVIKVGAVCATGDSCTSGVCDAAGKCALTVHPGNACKMPLTGAVGACLGDGTCQTPCKNGQACQGACGPGLCDASGHCLTPASSGKACKLPAFQNLCVSSCTCNGMGGLDLTTIPDGEPIKVPLKCYAGAICMAGQPIVPPENPQACDDGNPCTSHGCCEGWGEPCPSSIDYSGIAWSSSVDCVHGAGGNGECSGSGCFKRYCGADAFCEILTGPTTDCQKWCSAKCPSAPAPPYTICRTCSADINVDDCPVAWKNVDDGTSCGTNLICKAGQCILK